MARWPSRRSSQARTPAKTGYPPGIRCVVLDYDALRGMESDDLRLF